MLVLRALHAGELPTRYDDADGAEDSGKCAAGKNAYGHRCNADDDRGGQ
jgi:hypothetical protein